MKIVVIDDFGTVNLYMNVNTIPSIGFQVDMGYKPNPKVKEIVMWPRKNTLEMLKIESFDIEALVLVSNSNTV